MLLVVVVISGLMAGVIALAKGFNAFNDMTEGD